MMVVTRKRDLAPVSVHSEFQVDGANVVGWTPRKRGGTPKLADVVFTPATLFWTEHVCERPLVPCGHMVPSGHKGVCPVCAAKVPVPPCTRYRHIFRAEVCKFCGLEVRRGAIKIVRAFRVAGTQEWVERYTKPARMTPARSRPEPRKP